eukprot:TRINITY_DN17462_c0_g1_i1.p1 TRINITY_DN17462_c0_g1~~TRINITY_DN17462_c0_g1_i1.p1  ORF type:complete len:119 (-),score=6.20 TRINITY_DN17462_c0_g1_i1:180-536(-)
MPSKLAVELGMELHGGGRASARSCTRRAPARWRALARERCPDSNFIFKLHPLSQYKPPGTAGFVWCMHGSAQCATACACDAHAGPSPRGMMPRELLRMPLAAWCMLTPVTGGRADADT